jgi:hypothetical protein
MQQLPQRKQITYNWFRKVTRDDGKSQSQRSIEAVGELGADGDAEPFSEGRASRGDDRRPAKEKAARRKGSSRGVYTLLTSSIERACALLCSPTG